FARARLPSFPTRRASDLGQKVLVGIDSKAKGIQDLNGKRMCVAKGSTNFDNMKNYPKVIPVPVDDISDCMVLFQQGTADAVTGEDRKSTRLNSSHQIISY